MMGEETLATADWGRLERELDLWTAMGGNATFWWRDDDAASADPALDRLLDLRAGLPLALAVIPGRADASLAERIAGERDIAVLQHGWMHTNHAPKGERAAELGAHRPIEIILAELATGWRALSALLGRVTLPVLTPPWNRLTDRILPGLREAGYRGLSTSGPRRQREASRGLVQVNAHIDLVDWRARAFIGAPEALRRISAHLAARREGLADRGEPTGILTHHLVMDRASETFLERFVLLTRQHPASRWVAAAEAFASP